MNARAVSVSLPQCAPNSPDSMSLHRLLRGGGTLSAGLQNCRPCSSSSARRLRVLVDMDGVLADFEGSFLKKYRARYPKEPYIELEDRRGFWVSEQYGHLKPELSEKAISIWESRNFFLDLDPIDGAVAAVKEMSNSPNIDVFICTSPIKRYQYCPYEKYAWVEKHFGHEFLEQIILTRDKTVVSADLLIDDRPDITGAEPNPSWEHILFTACHNRHLLVTPPSRRLQSWTDDWKGILNSRLSQLVTGCKGTCQSELKE